MAEFGAGHARHVGVAGELGYGGGEPAVQEGGGGGDRVGDGGGVALAPGGLRQRLAVFGELGGQAVDGGQLKVSPAGVRRRQPAGRLFVEQALDHRRPARTGGVHVHAGIDARQRGVGLAVGLFVQRPHETARQPVAGGVDAGAPGPAVLEQAGEFGALRMALDGVGIEQREGAQAPAVDEQGAVVEGDAVHAGDSDAGAQRAQGVADLLVARAKIEAAVADQGRLRAGQLAAVRGRQLAAGRIEHLRIVGRGQHPVPGRHTATLQQREAGVARGRTGRRGGGCGCCWRAARQRSGDGPADMAAVIAGDEILRRQADGGGNCQRLFDRVGRLQLALPQVERLRVLGDPVHGVGAPVHAAQGAERSLAHRQVFVRAALDHDGFRVLGHGLPAGRRAHPARIVRIGRHFDQVDEVAVGIGVSPCHVAVAAHRDHRRRTGQGQAGHAARAAGGVVILHRQPVPGGRQLQAQVHVVGNDGAAVAAAGAGHHPVVAADGVAEIDACQRRRQRRGARRGCGALPPPGRRGRRDRGCRQRHRLGVERRVESTGLRQQEAALGGVAVIGDPAARQLASLLHRLQIEVHGPCHQQRIGGAPGARPGTGQHVFERPRTQRSDAVVDAGDIAVEKTAFLRWQLRQHRLGARPKPVQPVRAVERQRLGAEQLGQLAGARAPHQVHLKKALLSMDKAGGVGQVDAVGRRQQRHPARVARHRDDAGQSGVAAHPVQLRQAAPQIQPSDRHHQHDQGQQCRQQQRGAPAPSLIT